MMTESKRIGIALSGGGVRAAAFHAGVLLWMAERRKLETIRHVSSVSGGSLFAGLVFHLSGYKWPSSESYATKVYPTIRSVLTSSSLQTNALFRLLYPCNWRFLLSRANVVAQSIQHAWGINAPLSSLPDQPVWTINGTTAENGRRFRFKGTRLGDYELGYANAPDFQLADAMAISAAFPGGIGPLKVVANRFEWEKRKSWDSSMTPEKVEPTFRLIHIYDGGVYDNLGMEPLFDVGTQAIKTETGSPLIDFVMVSDAGSAFGRQEIPGPLNPSRLERVANIGFDQARALRVRSFVNFLQSNTDCGMYLQIGSNPVESIKRFDKKSMAIANDQWLTAENVTKAASYPTSLCKMKTDDFDLVALHGHQTASWNELVFEKLS